MEEEENFGVDFVVDVDDSDDEVNEHEDFDGN